MMQDREFHSSAEGEFNRPSREEFRLPREFSAMPDPDRPQSGETLPPKKRSLLRSRALMQVSAMLMSVVVVSNGFGIDLLGGRKDEPDDDYYYAMEQPDEGLPTPHLPLKYRGTRQLGLGANEKGEEQLSYITPSVWIVNDRTNESEEVPGMSYDPATNTLTMTNYRDLEKYLYIEYMGHDFKIRLVGSNELDFINVQGGSLTFVGNGALDLGYLYLNAFESDGCVMIDAPITLRLITEWFSEVRDDGTTGRGGMITVSGTLSEQGIYYTDKVQLKNAVRTKVWPEPSDKFPAFYLSALEGFSTDILDEWSKTKILPWPRPTHKASFEFSPP